MKRKNRMNSQFPLIVSCNINFFFWNHVQSSYFSYLTFFFFCRSRLAAASVLLPSSECLNQEVRRDVIQLLCSIFLANQGESEGAGEDKHFQLVGSLFQFSFRIFVSHACYVHAHFLFLCY